MTAANQGYWMKMAIMLRSSTVRLLVPKDDER